MYRTLNPGAINVSVSFEEGARLAARYGFEGLALDAGHLLEVGTDAVRHTLAEHGLQPGSFGLPVDIRGTGDAYEASLARLEPVAKAARQVGCNRASTYIFSWSDEKDYRANFDFHRERLARPAAILAELRWVSSSSVPKPFVMDTPTPLSTRSRGCSNSATQSART